MSNRLVTLTVIALLSLLTMTHCKRESTQPVPTLQLRLDNEIGMDERRARQVRMREFLWNHWRDKQRATLLLTYISKEGKRTDAEYAIRQMQPSTWVMVVTITRYRYGYNGQVFSHQVNKYDAYTIERVKPENLHPFKPESKAEVLPATAMYNGNEYRLRLTGWGGEVQGFF